MNLLAQAKEIIRTLISRKFYAECPCCQEPVLLKTAGLFYLDDFSEKGAKLYKEFLQEHEERRKEIRQKPKKIQAKSEISTKFINIGNILERIAPSLKTFHFQRNDCRSLFDPIDYLIFENLSKKGKVSRVIFAEIKTGGASLSNKQGEIRNLVEKKKVKFEIYEEAKPL